MTELDLSWLSDFAVAVIGFIPRLVIGAIGLFRWAFAQVFP